MMRGARSTVRTTPGTTRAAEDLPAPLRPRPGPAAAQTCQNRGCPPTSTARGASFPLRTPPMIQQFR